MLSSFPIKRSPFLGWEKMSVRSFLLFENHTKLLRVTQPWSAAECHLLPSIKAVVCFKRKALSVTLMSHVWNTAWKALLRAEQTMKVMVIIHLPFKKKKQANTKTYCIVFRLCFGEDFNISLKICFLFCRIIYYYYCSDFSPCATICNHLSLNFCFIKNIIEQNIKGFIYHKLFILNCILRIAR